MVKKIREESKHKPMQISRCW